MILNKVEHLCWDSQFFGYPVAKITLSPDGISCLKRIFEKLASENYRLAYFFVPPALKNLNERVKESGGILADQKVTYVKRTEKHHSFNHHIEDYQGTETDEHLKELVLYSGEYSRFRLDEKFVNNEYSRLYTEWLRKSINKTIASKTLIVKKGSRVVGLTTLGEKEGKADIGLVAVDEKFRGQGIGYDLIRFADSAANDMGLSHIQVVTQLKNKGACKIYEKCNFQINSIVNVYHYWRQ